MSLRCSLLLGQELRLRGEYSLDGRGCENPSWESGGWRAKVEDQNWSTRSGEGQDWCLLEGS